jgi:hypothetical protein
MKMRGPMRGEGREFVPKSPGPSRSLRTSPVSRPMSECRRGPGDEVADATTLFSGGTGPSGPIQGPNPFRFDPSALAICATRNLRIGVAIPSVSSSADGNASLDSRLGREWSCGRRFGSRMVTVDTAAPGSGPNGPGVGIAERRRLWSAECCYSDPGDDRTRARSPRP